MLEARAFEPDFLRRLDGLVLGVQRSRTVREGRRALGRVHGLGIEPESFKEYTEGDDLRFLDWNAFARLDDLTIRTFRAEREIEVTILVDASASMGLPPEDDKLGFALGLAASLAYVAMASNDAVRLGAFTTARSGAAHLRDLGAASPARDLPGLPAIRKRSAHERSDPDGRGDGASAARAAAGRHCHPNLRLSWSPPSNTNRRCAPFCARGTRSRSSTYWVTARAAAPTRPATTAYAIRKPVELCEVTLGPGAAASCRRRAERLSADLAAFCAANGIVYARAFGASHFDDIVMREFPRLGVVR